jgi:hypothetical protein
MQLYEDFYQSFIRCNHRLGLDLDWQLVRPEKPVRPLVEDLEKEYGVWYPEAFKQWFGMYYTLNMDCGMVRLPECPSNDPLRNLRGYWTCSMGMALFAEGFLPFGEEGNDSGPLCFDVRTPNQCPVVYYEHELSPKHPKAFSAPIFSSFDKMIECVVVSLDKEYDITAEEIFAIDPRGAGSTGREYWTSIQHMHEETDKYFEKEK